MTSNRVDAVLVAPCTANVLSKFAAGIADDPVSTLICTSLGTDIPLVIAPAMHEPMLKNPIIEQSIAKLRKTRSKVRSWKSRGIKVQDSSAPKTYCVPLLQLSEKK